MHFNLLPPNDYYLNLTKREENVQKGIHAWNFAQMKQAQQQDFFLWSSKRKTKWNRKSYTWTVTVYKCAFLYIETNSHLIVLLIKVKHCCFRPSWNIHNLSQIEFADEKLSVHKNFNLLFTRMFYSFSYFIAPVCSLI